MVAPRSAEAVAVAFTDYFDRTDGTLPELICTDGFSAYEAVIWDTYGVWLAELELTEAEEKEARAAGRPEHYFPVEITYATVIKEREKGRVVKVERTVVLGSEEQAAQALEDCQSKHSINISHLERWNGTQRHFNARKGRKVYTFSKELSCHVAATWLVVVWYNFCWCVRTLRQKDPESGHYHQRTPAMTAGLAEQPWSLKEVLSYPLFPNAPKDLIKRPPISSVPPTSGETHMNPSFIAQV